MNARTAPIPAALRELNMLIASGSEWPDAHGRVCIAFHLTDDQAKELEAAYDEDETPRAVLEALCELRRATKKFPTWPTDPLHALAVLGEEFGELTRAMLQLTYEPHKTSPHEVRQEAIQTAAMALRLVESLSVYQYRPCEQHKQRAV
jgi:hypothetical protein